ncbi:MAG TPA: ATP-binding cassette domain-containing protein, partial [Actinotalea sp.]|nr:ATP-binding cassette domain-containing protein [Actinotalea sp.]
MVHGLLGPNGAGKSTAVRVLATLADADGGTARVAGYDVRTQARLVRERIGVVGQQPAVDEKLGGRENLVMFAKLAGLSRSAASRRAADLLDRFDLTEAADRTVAGYSGGMRRRLDIAAALVTRPLVLFLDEPTTGLDPRARAEVWEMIRALVADGTTVLLTTQYLDEADQLASTVSVLDHGRVVATGSPEALKRQVGSDRISVALGDEAPDALLADLARRLADTTGGAVTVSSPARTLTVDARSGTAALVAVVRTLDDAGVVPEDLTLRRPTLDEAFLALTGSDAEAAR